MKYHINDLEKFLNCVNPGLLYVFKNYYVRPDPKPGDKFKYIKNSELNQPLIDIEYVGIKYDANFKNGVAFWYIFKDNNNNEIKVWSINDVYDPKQLTFDERESVYAFWRYCITA